MTDTNHEIVTEALREFADEDEQRRLWLSTGPPEVSSFDECFCRLFDDSGLIDSLEKKRVVFTPQIDQHLLQLDGLLKRVDASRPPRALLKDPALEQARPLARRILNEIEEARSEEGVPAKSSLEFLRREFVDLNDRSYRWIDLKYFRTQASARSEALAQLLHHVRYRDHYTSADSHETDSRTLHGPYLLSAISTDSFEEIDATQATTSVERFVSAYEGATDEGRRSVREKVLPLIHAASKHYRLKDLGTAAHHDFGWVLDDFMELVLINEERNELVLLVAAGD